MLTTPRILVATAILVALPACSSDPVTPPADSCTFVTAPFAGSQNAPRITSVILEVQTNGIVAAATATDPQGSDNMRDVLQSFSVFRNTRCEGTPILIRDDVAESGQEETFGTVVEMSQDAALFAEISAASTWPVVLDYVDRDGNRTMGTFRAQIVH